MTVASGSRTRAPRASRSSSNARSPTLRSGRHTAVMGNSFWGGALLGGIVGLVVTPSDRASRPAGSMSV